MGNDWGYGCNGVWIEGAHDCNGAFHSSQTVQLFKAKDLSPSGGMIQICPTCHGDEHHPNSSNLGGFDSQKLPGSP